MSDSHLLRVRSTQYGDVVYFSLADDSVEEPLVWTASIPTVPTFNFTPRSKVEDPSFALFQVDWYSEDEREVAPKRGKVVLPSLPLRLEHLQTGLFVTYEKKKMPESSDKPVAEELKDKSIVAGEKKSEGTATPVSEDLKACKSFETAPEEQKTPLLEASCDMQDCSKPQLPRQETIIAGPTLATLPDNTRLSPPQAAATAFEPVAQRLVLGNTPESLSFSVRPGIEHGVRESDEVAILVKREDSHLVLAKDYWFKGISPDRFCINRFEPYTRDEGSAIRLGKVCQLQADNGMFLSVAPNSAIDFKLLLSGEEMRANYADSEKLCYPEYQGQLRADLSNDEVDANTYWVIEGEDWLNGGALGPGTAFHLRHVASRRYLSADLTLTDTPRRFHLSSALDLAYGQLYSFMTEAQKPVSMDLTPSLSSVKTEIFSAVLSDLDPCTVLRLPLTANATHAQTQSLKFSVLKVNRDQANIALELALFLNRLSDLRLALQHLHNPTEKFKGINEQMNMDALFVEDAEGTLRAQIASDFQIVNEMLRIWILIKNSIEKQQFDEGVALFHKLKTTLENIQYYDRVCRNLFANRKLLLSLFGVQSADLADILRWSLKSHLPKDEERLFWIQQYIPIISQTRIYDHLTNVLDFCHFLMDRLTIKFNLSNTDFMKKNEAYLLSIKLEDDETSIWVYHERCSANESGCIAACFEFLADLCASTNLQDEISTELSMEKCKVLYFSPLANNSNVKMSVLYFISKVHVPKCVSKPPLMQLASVQLMEEQLFSRVMGSNEDLLFFNDPASSLDTLIESERDLWTSKTIIPDGKDPTNWYYNIVAHFRFIGSRMEHYRIDDKSVESMVKFVESMVSAAVALTWTALGTNIAGFSGYFPKLKDSEPKDKKVRIETEKQRIIEELLELLLIYQQWKLASIIGRCWSENNFSKDFIQKCIEALHIPNILNLPIEKTSQHEEVPKATNPKLKKSQTRPEMALVHASEEHGAPPEHEKVQVRAILFHIAYSVPFTSRGNKQIVLTLLEREVDFAEFASNHMRGIAKRKFFTDFLRKVVRIQSQTFNFQQIVENLGSLEEYISDMEELVDVLLKCDKDSFTEHQRVLAKADFIKELKRYWGYCIQVPEDLSEDQHFITLRTLTIEASRLYVRSNEDHKKQLLRILPMEGFYLDYPQYIQLLEELGLLDSGSEVASRITQLVFEMSLHSHKTRLLLAIKTLLCNSKLLSRAIFTMLKHYDALDRGKLSNCEWEVLTAASLALSPEDRLLWLAGVLEKAYPRSPDNVRREVAAVTILMADTSKPIFLSSMKKIIFHLKENNWRFMELLSYKERGERNIITNFERLADTPKARRNRNYEDMDSDLHYIYELCFEEKAGVLACLSTWNSVKEAQELAQEFTTLLHIIENFPDLGKICKELKTHLTHYFEAVDIRVLNEEMQILWAKFKSAENSNRTLSEQKTQILKLEALFTVPQEAAGPRQLVTAVLHNKPVTGPGVFEELKRVFLLKQAEDVYREACLKAAESIDKKNLNGETRNFTPLIEEMLDLAITHRAEQMQEFALRMLCIFIEKLGIRDLLLEKLQQRQLYFRFLSLFAVCIEKRKRLLSLFGADVVRQTQNTRVNSVNNMLQWFMELFKKCCDGCYVPFQTYLRSQGHESQSGINVVSLMAALLAELLDCSSRHEKLITSCAFALIEMVSGPCRENQEEVCRTFAFVTEFSKAMGQAAANRLSSDLEVECSLVRLALALLEGQERDYESVGKMMPMDFSVFGKLSEQCSTKLLDTEMRAMKLGLPVGPLEMKRFELATDCLIVCFSTMKEDKLGSLQDGSRTLFKHIASVEIRQPPRATPVTIFFRIPFIAQFLTRQTAKQVLSELDRDSRLVKLEDFTARVDQCEVEMMHQQRLARWSRLKAGTQYWHMYLLFSFSLIVILNLMLICLVHSDSEKRLTIDKYGQSMMLIVGLVQLVLITCGTVSYYLEYWYTLWTPTKRRVSSNAIKDLPYIKHLNKPYSPCSEEETNCEVHINWCEIAKALVQLTYAVLSLASIVLPYLYPILLFQILHLNSSVVNILKSVTNRAKQLLLAVFFALIVIFAHAFYAYFYLYDYYDNVDGMFCSNLHECFFSTINLGLRSGGGIGDALGPTSERDFYIRMVFDLLFYVTITTVLMAIVFGLIIDTFGQLRDEENDKEADMNNICLICGHRRSAIELKGEGWEKHTLQVHNPFYYMYFLLYLKKKNELNCSGTEKMVKKCRELKQVSFYPTTSAAIEKTEAGEED